MSDTKAKPGFRIGDETAGARVDQLYFWLRSLEVIDKDTVIFFRDGRLCVKGDVSFPSGVRISFPVSFGSVWGSFSAVGCGLTDTDLIKLPRKVYQKCDISDNSFSSLEEGPLFVSGSFTARNCGLRTSAGVPDIVGKVLDLSFNKLSGEYLFLPTRVQSVLLDGNSNLGVLRITKPKKFKILSAQDCGIEKIDIAALSIGMLDLSDNPIRNLFGSPKRAKVFIMRNCRSLRSFKGISLCAIDTLNASNCSFTSFEHLPQNIRNLTMPGNKCIYTIGLPKRAEKIDISFCGIKRITECPSRLEEFNVIGNEIEIYQHGPKRVTNLLISRNPIKQLRKLPEVIYGNVDAQKLAMSPKDIKRLFEKTKVAGFIFTDEDHE
jgi:hypothetical protein